MGYVRTAGLSTAARRARRRAALVITALLAVLALVLLLSVASVQGWFGQGGADDSAATTAVAVPPPLTAEEVTVNVFNSTSTVGLAGRTADGLRVRGFEVGTTDNSDAVEGVGVVRHGPAGAEAAELLEEVVGQDLELVVDAEREGTEIDLVLGPDWEELPSADDSDATDGR